MKLFKKIIGYFVLVIFGSLSLLSIIYNIYSQGLWYLASIVLFVVIAIIVVIALELIKD
jgi:predicted membrane channel-forming protein YqfA (hemolysin III family)